VSDIYQHITTTQVTRMSCDMTKPLCDNDHMYNYHFSLMSTLNTMHSMPPLSCSILGL